MRIVIEKSGGDTCANCGRYEVLYTPSSNQNLEQELLAAFVEEVPWWRPVKRRIHRRLIGQIERATDELRAATIRL